MVCVCLSVCLCPCVSVSLSVCPHLCPCLCPCPLTCYLHIGWLIKLEMKDSKEYDGLMSQSDYMKFIEESS